MEPSGMKRSTTPTWLLTGLPLDQTRPATTILPSGSASTTEA